jgi:hypothetical protein
MGATGPGGGNGSSEKTRKGVWLCLSGQSNGLCAALFFRDAGTPFGHDPMMSEDNQQGSGMGMHVGIARRRPDLPLIPPSNLEGSTGREMA